MKSFFRFFYWLRGWKFEMKLPKDLKKFVLVGAPHTSNWDFPAAMALLSIVPVKVHFAIKKEWTQFPYSLFMKPLGAVGIDRKAIKDGQKLKTTDVLANLFDQYHEFALGIAPEGTRKPRENWKTGFYHIAQKANVPIVLGFVDYKKKIMGITEIIKPENFEMDMKRIIDFYRPISACIPENFKLDSRF